MCIRDRLKTTVGAFGILAALLTFLPVLLQTALWYFTVNITSAVGEMLGVKQVASILKSASATLGVLIAVISVSYTHLDVYKRQRCSLCV